eukprot:jgi/Botrbrau1/20646/Bobra.113_1s0070.1
MAHTQVLTCGLVLLSFLGSHCASALEDTSAMIHQFEAHAGLLMESKPPAELAIAGGGIPSTFSNGLGYNAEEGLAQKADIRSVYQEGHTGQSGIQAMQATRTASVPEYSYTGGVPSAAPAREQLPLVPLPPANLSSVLSPLYGRPSGVVKYWDDGATWDALSGLRLWIGGCQDKTSSAPPVIVGFQALYSSREGAVRGYGWGRAPDVEIRLQSGEQLVGVSGVFGQAIQQLTFVTSLGRTLGPYGANPATGSPFSFTGKIYSFAGVNSEDLSAVSALAFWTEAVNRPVPPPPGTSPPPPPPSGTRSPPARPPPARSPSPPPPSSPSPPPLPPRPPVPRPPPSPPRPRASPPEPASTQAASGTPPAAPPGARAS